MLLLLVLSSSGTGDVLDADELLADALDRSGGAEMVYYIERIEQKDCATRILIYKVLDTLLEALCEKGENRQSDYFNRNSYYTGL